MTDGPRSGRPLGHLRVAMLLHKDVTHDSRVRREAALLARDGHYVTVLELADVPDRARQLDGFTRRSVKPPAWVRRRLPAPLYRLLFLAGFVRGILRLRPDVVHAHDAAMLLPGLIGARLTGAQLVYDSHELATSVPYRDRAWARFVEEIERLAVPRAAAVITVSEGIAAELQRRYRLSQPPAVLRNVSALPRPAADRIGALRRALGEHAGPLVLHQGAPAEDRGCETLLRATAELPGDVRLVLLGDGEPAFVAGLRDLARELGIADRVDWLPSVPLDELLAWTADADVGVALLQDTCANHRLALPNKLFEYVAAGVPVVTSDLPEMRRVVERHGLGWTADATDPAAVAGALRVALAADRTVLGQTLDRAAATLSWAKESQGLTGLYERLARRDVAARHRDQGVSSRSLRPRR